MHSNGRLLGVWCLRQKVQHSVTLTAYQLVIAPATCSRWQQHIARDSWKVQTSIVSGLRHRIRIAALQVLFEVSATDHPLDIVLERRLQEEELSDENAHFLQRMVFGVWERRYYLDQIIAEAAPSWPLDQMPGVDKAILRIALFELLINDTDQTPMKAVINEAVELAKHFGSDNSARFVNGVLGTVVNRYLE